MKRLYANEVMEMTGLKKTAFYKQIKNGNFPAPIKEEGARPYWLYPMLEQHNKKVLSKIL